MSKWFYIMLGTYIILELLTRMTVLGAFDNQSPLSPKAAWISLLNMVALIIIIIAMYNLCV